MTTKVKRSARVLSDFAKHGMTYLLRRDQISPLEKERNREKNWLKKYIDEEGSVDGKGNRNVYFDSPVPGPGNTNYYGLTQRRTPGAEFMDASEVKAFAEKLSPLQSMRVIKQVEFIDVEELYVLQQEGVITAKELRGLIRHQADSYQLWPITDPPMEDEYEGD